VASGHESTGRPRHRTIEERRAAADERRARRAAVTEPAAVMDAAAALLAVRPRTVDETRRRLRHLGYRADLCDRTVDRLVELGYLDDAEFARAWVERRDRIRPRGEVVLRRELRARGIPDDAISAALRTRSATRDESGAARAEPGGDEAAARHLLDRRRASLMRETDPRRRRQKAYALLARNGFDPDLCQRVASTFGDDEAGD
jgi:regulatory protein